MLSRTSAKPFRSSVALDAKSSSISSVQRCTAIVLVDNSKHLFFILNPKLAKWYWYRVIKARKSYGVRV
jgi:hypothetical protein